MQTEQFILADKAVGGMQALKELPGSVRDTKPSPRTAVRIPKHKELRNTRLANTYGGWMYCEGCGKTIGYLCYVTYDLFKFKYQCKCGNCGEVDIAFENSAEQIESVSLRTIKNRMCCSADESPLITILAKKLDMYMFEVVCKACNTKYRGGNEL